MEYVKEFGYGVSGVALGVTGAFLSERTANLLAKMFFKPPNNSQSDAVVQRLGMAFLNPPLTMGASIGFYIAFSELFSGVLSNPTASIFFAFGLLGGLASYFSDFYQFIISLFLTLV